MTESFQKLNSKTKQERLDALRQVSQNSSAPIRTGKDMNNHIHTTYSFSPYSPTMAVWKAYESGLSTCGIIDHDSISGAEEFIEAGKILDFPTTIGFEMRVSFNDTPFADRRINNPDQIGNVYCTVHAIPHDQIDTVKLFFEPIHIARGKRNRAMVQNINELLVSLNIVLDYDNDVVPLSMSYDGGSITERHLMFALAQKFIEKHGKGSKLIEVIESNLPVQFSDKMKTLLLDTDNPFYQYDLLGAFKSDLIPLVYIPASIEECPNYRSVVDFANKIGAISSYAYLGDIGDSVTGDKKSQKFEDDFLDEIFEFCKNAGFHAISYMPSRNTMQQLKRVQKKCKELSLLQISGEDINQPRQGFICENARDASFSNLIDTTWVLIGNEKVATGDLNKAFFATETVEKYPDLNQRVEQYKKYGLEK